MTERNELDGLGVNGLTSKQAYGSKDRGMVERD